MKTLTLVIAVLIGLSTSCSKEDETPPTKQEITSIDSISHVEATEMLRLNILSEYGGSIRQFELYHAEVFDIGMPCDSTFDLTMDEVNDLTYNLSTPLEISTNCQNLVGGGQRNFYYAYQRDGLQTANSDKFSIEVLLNGTQTISDVMVEDRYSYGNTGFSEILITEGISPELDPKAFLTFITSQCTYDREQVRLTEVTEISFRLKFSTNEGPMNLEQLEFKGIIKLTENKWTITYDDGIIDYL